MLVDVKFMLGKVLKISRQCLPPFFSYRENPAGRAEFAPPTLQRGAGYSAHPVAKRHFNNGLNCVETISSYDCPAMWRFLLAVNNGATCLVQSVTK